MSKDLEQKKNQACWTAHQLFDRKMGPGTTGNLSFLHEGKMYITASGTCFGDLKPEDFTEVDMTAEEWTGRKPSKELPLHMIVYRNRPDVQAVIHVHSTYAVLWSCITKKDPGDCIPSYTPYLKMQLGSAGLVPYAAPGSQKLFDLFEEHLYEGNGWLLKNHGPIVGGKNLRHAFACIEELEEACHIAWECRDLALPEITEEE